MDNTPAEKHPTPILSNGTYDLIKWVAQYLLPGIGALYFALAQIWGLPNPEQVVGTIVAVDAFLGVILGLSTIHYNKSDAKYDGALVVDTSSPERDLYSFEIGSVPLEELSTRREITLRIEVPTQRSR